MSRRKVEAEMLPGVENEPRTPRTRTKNSAATRRLSTPRIIVIALSFVITLAVALYVFHRIEQFLIQDPRFALGGGDTDTPAVEIAGAAHASRTQIQRVFAIDAGRSVYLLPLTERRETLRTVDWVKDASIARLWPNRIVVSVKERKPVAFLPLSASKFAMIDEDGVILPPAADRFALPVLRGIKPSDPITERRDRVHRMQKLVHELGDASRNLSEIDVSDRDNLKATEPRDGHMITLLMGDHDFAARYQNFVNYYTAIKRRLPNGATLDLRLDDRITVVE